MFGARQTFERYMRGYSARFKHLKGTCADTGPAYNSVPSFIIVSRSCISSLSISSSSIVVDRRRSSSSIDDADERRSTTIDAERRERAPVCWCAGLHLAGLLAWCLQHRGPLGGCQRGCQRGPLRSCQRAGRYAAMTGRYAAAVSGRYAAANSRQFSRRVPLRGTAVIPPCKALF